MITYGIISWEARKYIFWTKIFANRNPQITATFYKMAPF